MKIGPALNEKNLVFGYDTGRNPSSGFDHRVRGRRYFKGKNTVNFFPDGHFPNGTDMSAEGGSNPTNTIVELENPGDSKYVLQQTMGNANTEYQLYLSTQLSANTTYTLSGWYAESSDYSGASRMFHSRAYSAGGSHRSLGTGIYNVIATKIVGGLTWKYCYANITTPSDYSNTFYWFVGYSSSTYSGARYYTNLKMEQGSYPTPYHAGTRSSTNSLIDLAKNRTIDVNNVSFDSTGLPTFDGTDDFMDLGSDVTFKSSGGWTVESVVKYNSVPGGYNNSTSPGNFIGAEAISYSSWYWSVLNSKLAIWNINPGVWKYGSTTIQANTWYHTVLTCSNDGTSYQMYLNGVAEGGTHASYSFNASYSGLKVRYFGMGKQTAVRRINGYLPVSKIYDRVLTDREIKANYNQYKNRFNF